MRISNRLAVAIVMFGVVATAASVVGWVAVATARMEQNNRVEALLRSELTARRDRVQDYLNEVAQDLNIIAATRIVQEGIVDFGAAFEDLGGDAMARLQDLYIDNNPNPVGRKNALVRANDDSLYSALHARYHEWFSRLADVRDYYDIFLVTGNGDVVYTVYKETDFATNLLAGRYKDSELAETFRRIKDDPHPGALAFRDFVRYAPSNDLPAAFVGTPLILDGEFVGALLVQLKADRFDDLMKYSRIMGESGETYLVGPDHLMRSRSRFETNSTVLKTLVDTASVRAALANTTGVHKILDYRGVPVRSAYAPLSWQGLTWAVLAEIDEAEVEAPIATLIRRVVLIGTLCSVAAFLLGLALAEGRNPVCQQETSFADLREGSVQST